MRCNSEGSGVLPCTWKCGGCIEHRVCSNFEGAADGIDMFVDVRLAHVREPVRIGSLARGIGKDFRAGYVRDLRLGR